MMCADTLANRGFDVQVFDMGRRATGGRASVRYTQEVRLLLLINLLISLYQGGGTRKLIDIRLIFDFSFLFHCITTN